ncbi:hypothetical protein [Microbacterium resistens]|uniref:Uncharacterized protein n=1 Tax=Microbacterium resistens TaxID=156977 RepID=A0ABY3RVJ7_9MICO|nr:hypothetical protein [Microbacterium resistens]UGS26914.1 hypothetical protein K8F61_01410 [Microbacterium resistens]
MMFYGGFPAVGMLLFWLLTIVILGGTVYLAVRFAVLHALKSHTRWIDAGKPSGPPAPPQTPGGPPPYGAPPAPGAPPAAPPRP